MGGDTLLARSAVELLLWLPTPLPCNGCASTGADGVGARGNSACAEQRAPEVIAGIQLRGRVHITRLLLAISANASGTV